MPARNNSGFTLIETVISMLLLSFITIIGYQSLMFGLDQWDRGQQRMRQHYDYQLALGWMRDKLGAAERVGRVGGNGNSYLFDGNSQSVEFVARVDRARRVGLYVSRIFLDRQDHGLYVSYYLHHPDVVANGEPPEPERVLLLADVNAVSFAYYGRQLRSKRKGWQDSWPEQNSLPQLIRLDLETVQGDRFQSTLSVLTSNNV